MKKKILASTMALITALAIGAGSANAMGFIYTNASYPVTATGINTPDLHKLKKGSASTMNVLFAVEWGDAGVNKAAQAGNIKNISYIDIHEKTVLFFFRKLTTTVYGE